MNIVFKKNLVITGMKEKEARLSKVKLMHFQVRSYGVAMVTSLTAPPEIEDV